MASDPDLGRLCEELVRARDILPSDPKRLSKAVINRAVLEARAQIARCIELLDDISS